MENNLKVFYNNIRAKQAYFQFYLLKVENKLILKKNNIKLS